MAKQGSYDEFKAFEGKRYTGMKIGRSHKWYYDQGEWKETKLTPDLWELHYEVTKRRAGHAPEGSGVPVGTGYHWYILAHQHVEKLNANDYTTAMTGLKFKVAHKRAGKDAWNVAPKTQRKRMIRFLEGVIDQLRADDAAEAPARKAKKKTAKKKVSKKTTAKKRPATRARATTKKRKVRARRPARKVAAKAKT